MNTNKKGETLISILIGMFIISIIIMSIVSVLSSNYVIQDDYTRNNKLILLQSNATNVIKALDFKIEQKDIFFLYKNKGDKKFEVFTGATNDKYKYIDEYGEYSSGVTTPEQNYGTGEQSELDKRYSRIFYLQTYNKTFGVNNTVIKAAIHELINNNAQ